MAGATTRIRPEELTIVRGCDITGRDCWYLVRTSPSKAPMLKKKAEADEALDVRAFGEVIESGYGEPAADLLKRYTAH